ncbi:hypothetical protein QTG54_007376 [Skeletonema marinoi]|uniref:Uncharacterized protein n=1 Tax=Skeletonema marinoi TaxID=267567 RepID=A0AAD8Y8V1_9STRA|nr:hypothetical protein QTG54_007376 [Skeletonema marinoi]
MQASNVPYSKSEDSGDVSSMASDGCGSVGSSVGMSPHRQYNTAMAKRMRQRRMRRMKKRDATPATFSERVKAAKGDDEQYKQQKSSSSTPPRPQAEHVPKNIVTRKKNKSHVTFYEEDIFPDPSPELPSDSSGEVEVFDEKKSAGAIDTNEEALDSWKNEVQSDSTAPLTQNTRACSSETLQHEETPISFLTPDRLSSAWLKSQEVNKDEEDETPADVHVERDSPRGVSSPNAPGSSHDDNPKPLCGEGLRGSQPYQDDDIDEDVRQSIVFQALRKQMLKPSPQLEELLKQIRRDFSTQIDRTFATRRKNACGALKILAAKEENRLKICWTLGVLPAIASVLLDVHEVIQDEQNRLANIEARNRIVSALLDLSLNKKNRVLIVSTPGLLDSIAQTILNDDGEGRQGCCTVLLYLSKTAETRSAIAKNKGLMDAITKVVEVPTWIAPQQPQIPDVCKFDMDTMDTPSTHDDMSCTSSEHYNSDYSYDNNMKEDSDGADEVQKSDEKRFTFTLSVTSFVDTIKSKETVNFIAREDTIIDALLKVSLQFYSPSHVRALTILAHLTRYPQNCHLLFAGGGIGFSRCRGTQICSLCFAKSLGRHVLSGVSCAHCQHGQVSYKSLKHYESKGELIAAIATLQNLADEPANLIQFTTVKNCVASIIEVARSDDNGEKESDLASYLAKNTLATLSHWFRRIATSGSERIVNGSGDRAPHILHNAVLRPTTYQGWS